METFSMCLVRGMNRDRMVLFLDVFGCEIDGMGSSPIEYPGKMRDDPATSVASHSVIWRVQRRLMQSRRVQDSPKKKACAELSEDDC